MLEQIYDDDVALGGARHTIEVYWNEAAVEALVLFVPTARITDETCEAFLNHAREVLASVAPSARSQVLLFDQPMRRYRWLDHDPPPPRWRDAREDEVRERGLIPA